MNLLILSVTRSDSGLILCLAKVHDVIFEASVYISVNVDMDQI